MREHIQTSWKFDLRPQTLLAPSQPARGFGPEMQHKAFEEWGTDVPTVEACATQWEKAFTRCELAPLANILFLQLNSSHYLQCERIHILSFGSWLRLKRNLLFPSAINDVRDAWLSRSSGFLCAAHNVLDDLWQFFTQGKFHGGHNKNIMFSSCVAVCSLRTCVYVQLHICASAFHSFSSHPSTAIVHWWVGGTVWGQLNRAVDV